MSNAKNVYYLRKLVTAIIYASCKLTDANLQLCLERISTVTLGNNDTCLAAKLKLRLVHGLGKLRKCGCQRLALPLKNL